MTGIVGFGARTALVASGRGGVCGVAGWFGAGRYDDRADRNRGPACGVFSPGDVVADPNYVVPTGGGTITSFSFQSTAANAGEQLDFLVLQLVSGSTYKIVGKTGVKTLKGTGLETFSPPSNISVQAGEILGFWIPPREP